MVLAQGGAELGKVAAVPVTSFGYFRHCCDWKIVVVTAL